MKYSSKFFFLTTLGLLVALILSTIITVKMDSNIAGFVTSILAQLCPIGFIAGLITLFVEKGKSEKRVSRQSNGYLVTGILLNIFMWFSIMPYIFALVLPRNNVPAFLGLLQNYTFFLIPIMCITTMILIARHKQKVALWLEVGTILWTILMLVTIFTY